MSGTVAPARPVWGWRPVVAAQGVSLSGAYAQQIALAALGLAADGPTGLAVVVAVRYLPALAAPLAGTLVGRRDRRRILRVNTAWQMALTAVFAVVVAACAGRPPLATVAVFAAAYGIGGTIDMVCTPAVVADRAGTAVVRASSVLSATSTVTRVASAAAAAALLAVAGPAALLAWNAVSFAALVVVLTPRRAPLPHRLEADAPPAGPADASSTSHGEAAAASRAAKWWADRSLWGLGAGFVVWAALSYQPAVLLPLVSADRFSGQGGVAVLTLAASIGTAVASVAGARWPGVGWPRARWGLAACAAGAAGMAVAAGGLMLVAAAVYGAGIATVLGPVNALVASTVAPSSRAAAFGWVRACADGLTPAGGFVVAAAGSAWGPPGAAWLCAAGAAAATVVTVAVARLALRSRTVAAA